MIRKTWGKPGKGAWPISVLRFHIDSCGNWSRNSCCSILYFHFHYRIPSDSDCDCDSAYDSHHHGPALPDDGDDGPDFGTGFDDRGVDSRNSAVDSDDTDEPLLTDSEDSDAPGSSRDALTDTDVPVVLRTLPWDVPRSGGVLEEVLMMVVVLVVGGDSRRGGSIGG